MNKYLAPCLMIMLVATNGEATAQQSEIAAINRVLDGYHAAAAEGDWDTYFAFMSDDGVFLGTDAGERWQKRDFQHHPCF